MHKILLEASVLNFNRAGTARVARALSRALTRLAPDDMSFRILPSLPDLEATTSGLARRLFVLYWESFYVPYLLPARAKRWRADLVHCLAPLPLSAAIRREGLPVITTIYDVICFTHPQWFTPVMRHRLCRWIARSARFSDHFLAISGFTKDSFCESLSVPAQRVSVTRLGGLEETPVADDPLVSEPFVLTVGTLEPRKNLRTVLEAYALLGDRVPEPPRLVVVGGEGWGGVDPATHIDRLGLRDRVEVLGYVSDDSLAGLYRQAEMLVYPSLCEGFGLPALEAMGLGCPVIASGGGGLAEVVGEAALRVDPEDAEGLAEAMASLLADRPLAARVRAEGLEQAARFSWEKCALDTIRAYRTVLGRT